MRIVFCDDDPMILRQLLSLVKEYFASLGGIEPEYTVYRSGDELIRQGEQFDIAFLDVEMPGVSGICIYRIKLASCTENFRQVAGENLPPRRKGPPVMGSASRSGWQSVGSVIVVGNRDAILGQNSLQQLSAFQVKV